MRILIFLLFFPVYAAAYSVVQVAPGIYVHYGEHKDIDIAYGGDICNSSFVVGSKGIAVIDTGGSPKIGKQLREQIRKVSTLPILYVINTHVHPDHTLGNAAFKQDQPIFVGHHQLASFMAQRSAAYLANQRLWVGVDAEGTELIAPQLAVQDTQELDLGDRKLQLSAYPLAHSATDLSVFDSSSSSLWTGDLLFITRTPSIDGDLPGWLKVIAQLREIPAARVIPGHGPVRSDVAAALDDEKNYLTVLLMDVRAAISRGDSMEQTIETAARAEQGKWLLFDIVNWRNIALIFPKLEWE